MQLSYCGIQACCYIGLSALLFLQNGALVLYADTSSLVKDYWLCLSVYSIMCFKSTVMH